MSKYEPLWNYIKDNKQDNYKLTYEEIKIEYIKGAEYEKIKSNSCV